MKTDKTIIVAFLVMGMTISASAQSLEPFNPYGIFSPAVESYEMIKYGSLTPALYTGAMTFSVPLYTYSDPDFSIPISLEYSFDGYRPAQHSGSIGYGWHLECGGVITRTVRGYPDEGDQNNHQARRGWRFSLDLQNRTMVRTSATVITENINFERYCELMRSYDAFSDIPAYTTESQRHVLNDIAPDEYHFSFMGYSGDFVMNKNGEYIVYNCNVPEGEIKVEVCGSAGQPGEFIITLGNGFRYEFSDYEYSTTTPPSSADHFHPSIVATSYKLSKIVAPNDAEAQFEYITAIEPSLYARYGSDKSGIISMISEWQSGSENEYIYSDYISKWGMTRNNVRYLSKIIIKGEEIVLFNYGNAVQNEYSAQNYIVDINFSESLNMAGQKQLNSITVSDFSGNTIDFIEMTHVHPESGTPKSFLSSVTSRQNGTYSFGYDISGVSFPKNNTENVDYWGYWNSGNITNMKNILRNALYFNGSGASQLSTNLYDQVIGNDKNPDWQKSRKGALAEIEYPTGGTSKIEYEPNQASRRVNVYRNSSMLVLESCQLCEVGGVRVSKITDSSNGESRNTIFQYIDDQNSPSGIINSMPRYCETASYEHNNQRGYGGIQVLMSYQVEYSNINAGIIQKESHISYPSVYTIHPDGSKTLNTFTSIATGDEYHDAYNMARYGSGKKVFSFNDSMNSYINIPSTNLVGTLTHDRSGMRGKPMSTVVYDNQSREVMRTEYTYSLHPTSLPDYYVNEPLSYYHVYTSSANARLVSKTEIRDGISNTTSYTYNAKGQMSSEETDDILEGTRVWFQYVHDSVTQGQSGETNAVEWGYDKQLSDAVKTRTTDGYTYIIAAEHYDYLNSGAPSIHPTTITSYIIDTPIIVCNGTDIQSMLSLLSNCETKISNFQYDSMGRLIRADLPGGAYIEYEWTSDGRYIISKAVNANNNMVEYEWKDMVGMSKMRDAAGHIETYLYDGHNRLQQRTDTKGNPTEKYYYHLINE